MDAENDLPSPDDEGELVPRQPSVEDLMELCCELNARGARYVVVGGFAIRASGYVRETMDIDLLVATDLENEARVFKSLEIFPDKAVLQLDPGDVAKYTVVRVADEVLVDLMQSACGIDYAEAAKDVVIREVQGVPIPFASPRLLWRMKKPTNREKDAGDLVFLREWFRQRGEEPPEC
jgi:predicted nucleotidyltransferase